MSNIDIERLTELRLSHGYSQKYIAIELGVAQSIVSRWETGLSEPSKKNLNKLANLYGVSTDYLMGRSDETSPAPSFDSGAALHTARIAHEYTLNGIALIAGVGPKTVAAWEANRPKAPRDKLALIAGALNLPVEELTGPNEMPMPSNAIPYTPSRAMVKVVGTVRCGEGGLAVEEYIGIEPADVSNPDEYFYLIAEGDSMEPKIMAGDKVLVHRQEDVECGELAVVIVDGEEGTLKRVIKKPGLVILEPLNRNHEARYFSGEEINTLCICGKAVEIKRKL